MGYEVNIDKKFHCISTECLKKMQIQLTYIIYNGINIHGRSLHWILKRLLKEIKEDLSEIDRCVTQFVTTSIFPKMIYRFNASPTKNFTSPFYRTFKEILKFIW